MNIQSIQSVKPSFKAAYVSINAISDTHGELLLSNSALEEMRKRKSDIFYTENKGCANIIAVCGDWFMNGGKKGYITDPKKPLAGFQLTMLNEFFAQIKELVKNTKTLFTLGNHEFDGGVFLLDEILSGVDADIIASNLNLEESYNLSKSISGNKIFNEKVIDVEDDKNPNLKHKLLFLAVMPVNLKMYQKELDGISLTDLNDKPLANIEIDDYQNTLNECADRIAKFKNENPNGIVIFLSHAGADLADNLARISDIDIAFDGHEHKTKTRVVNRTPIIPLSKDFQKIANAKIEIGDNGQIDAMRLFDFDASKNKRRGPLFHFYHKLLAKDIEKIYSVRADNPDVEILDDKGVREGNSFLANFITDSVLAEIKKKDASVDIFAINASAIRHPIEVSDEPSVSSFDIKNVLAGIKEDDGQIMLTDVNGIELIFMVIDNMLFSRTKPQKNPIIHYSGLVIDRQKIIKAIEECKSFEEISQYIILSNTNEPVDLRKTYKIANVEKYFNKSQITAIKKLKNRSEYFGATVQDLFQQHFVQEKDNLWAKCDFRIN
ncbi:metallophosphoesterase [bacterium]|nr:metallophosphoesterase [bacterium]